MPALIGLTGDQASAALRAADFRAVDFTVNYAAMNSTVEWQSPAPGTLWSKTSSVRLTLDPTTATPALPQPNPVYTAAPAAPTTPYVEPSSTYTYKVTGRNRAMITYSASGGNTSQVSSARLPWSKAVDSPGISGMDFAYVSAQNSGSGTIFCQIIGPSGNVISENSSEGPYAIVTCQK
ncbi:PASTA domain-containing protein [Pseudonocardia endophytica]|uniref:PASTA domain-containing protein n=1 Tax=Pseudonocardia endophytica TaxID=401976 RepID=UPI001404B6C7|nr:PASTA domain-containing protein [Pseudonocardia endophytica]